MPVLVRTDISLMKHLSDSTSFLHTKVITLEGRLKDLPEHDIQQNIILGGEFRHEERIDIDKYSEVYLNCSLQN